MKLDSLPPCEFFDETDFFLLILIMALRNCLLSCCQCDLKKKTTSVFELLYVIAFILSYSKTVVANVTKV